MKFTMRFVFAALLVLNSAPRSLLKDDPNTVVARDEAAGTISVNEAMEDCNDDRLTDSFALASAVTPPYSSPTPSFVIQRTSDELNSIKENSRIYKLNSAFLI